MGYQQLRNNLDRFDALLRKLGLCPPAESAINGELTLVREFLADEGSMDQDAWVAKWGSKFDEWWPRINGVVRLVESLGNLDDQPPGELRPRLKDVLAGSVKQDLSPQHSKDILYEFEIAHVFKMAGFTVSLAEPDVVLSGNGLGAPLGLACKYPSSRDQIHAHLSKGYKQISTHTGSGVVVIGMDYILFPNKPKYLDFRDGDVNPMHTAQRSLAAALNILLCEREAYPSEKPIDGLLLTIRLWGAYGKPAGIVGLSALTLQCGDTNPIRADLCTIVRAVQALAARTNYKPSKSERPDKTGSRQET